MQLQPAIKFRGIRPGEGLEEEIRRRLVRLCRYYPAIVGCRVVLQLSDRHHQVGGRFEVHLDLSVPGRRHVLVSHVANPRVSARQQGQVRYRKADEINRDRRIAMVAVRDAFEVARRRLQDLGRIQRHDVKGKTEMPHGRVTQFDGTMGFIEAADGHEVYFQKSSLLGAGRQRMRVGSDVAFVEERGDKGPQASTVRML